MVVFLLNVKLVLHLENVPIAHGRNVAAIGFQCNARVILIIIWLQSSSCNLHLHHLGALELFAKEEGDSRNFPLTLVPLGV